MMENREHYLNSSTDVVKEFGSDIKKGLSTKEVEQLIKQYGKNELQQKEKISALDIFISQFSSPIVWVLIGAVVISLFLKEFIDASVIGVILIMNAILGFVQEYKAEKAIDALQKLSSLNAVVVRDGKEVKIDAKDIVPGDILILETGEKIPADSRLLETTELQTQEATLTGESTPIIKNIEVIKKKCSIGDRVNMIFSGTVITNGKGKAIVTETGMNTEIGKIAHLIQTTKTSLTPLQKSLKILGKWLGIITLAIVVIVFLAGIIKGEDPFVFFLVAVALAVAAIPEGLPIVVTICMSIGVQKMAKRNALIRRLPSVETLGCATVICSDKTGTLTHNEMTVKRIFVDNEIVDVSGAGYESKGSFSKKPISLELLLQIGKANNDAVLENKKGSIQVIGDPTEAALIVSAQKFGLYDSFERSHEIPFTSERKRMTTLHSIEGKQYAYTKGAPDIVLNLCSKILIKGKEHILTKQLKDRILQQNEEFAKDALRVIGFAYKRTSNKKDLEKEMVFVGLQGMIDPPRQEVKDSIAKASSAGIRTIMITGDHKTTAEAIANELGINGRSISGSDLKNINLDRDVESISIYARVNPEDKLNIVNALKKKGYIVAMTGDGVNDAPALKKADLGIAMGISGTDVSKEAADMILLDDNFTSIVNAIEEGRVIYDNIRKFVTYLLSSNIGEVLTVFISIMAGISLPVTAIMILWINLVTDGLPALALGLDPAEPGIMDRPPRKVRSKIVSGTKGLYMLTIGFVMMIGTLGIFKYAELNGSYIYATTMAFTTLVMFQLFNVLNSKSDHHSIFTVGIFKNMWLWGAIGISAVLQLIVIYVPFFNRIFETVPISLGDWVIIILTSSSVLIIGEFIKIWLRITNKDLN